MLHIRLTPEEMKRLEKHAARHGLTVSNYARACIQRDWVESGDQETIRELVQDATERLAGRLLATIGSGKAEPTGQRAFPSFPRPRPKFIDR